MQAMYSIISYKIADGIKLRELRNANQKGVIFSTEKELFYQISKMRYISIFNYGVVSFFNIEEPKMEELKKRIYPFCENKFKVENKDEYFIDNNAEKIKYQYNRIEMPKYNLFVLRLVMFHVAQSIALTNYFEQTKRVLEETNRHTLVLGKKGIISLKGRTLKKFLGKTLQIKNQIVENLYILDFAPGSNGDESNIEMSALMKESLSQYLYWKSYMEIDIDEGMKEALVMQYRSEMIYEELKIIKEQIDLFSDTLQHSANIKLEWVIIVLVAYEVIDLIIKNIR
jgi:required for meiotic nuclear division protein 1